MRTAAAIALLLVFGSASAAFGYLVSSSTTIVAGKLYWNCVYDVQGARISQLRSIDQGVCPISINF